MSVARRHILKQGPAIGALGRTALSAIRQQISNAPPPPMPALPGPELQARFEPRPGDLVSDYIRHVGGDVGSYRGTVPAHLFPQWGFGLAGQAIANLPYPLARVLNAGCRMQINSPIPANEPLQVRAWLESVDDDGRRALLQQRVITSTPSAPEALVADMFVLVPLGGDKNAKTDGKANGKTNGKKPEKKASPRVPSDARELAFFKLGDDAGLDFAKLTGDFNPVHWVGGYARAFGFRNVILHGFGTMARAVEALNRGVLAGDVHALEHFECRFTKPLVLPARVGVYVHGDELFVGDAPGGPAYLTGKFTRRKH